MPLHTRPIRLSFFFLSVLSLLLPALPAYSGTLHIAVISDADTPEIRSFMEEVLSEAHALLGQKKDIRIAAGSPHVTAADAAAIQSTYKALALRKDIDLILAIGGFCAPVLGRNPAFPKPLIALGVTDPRIQQLPLTPQGSSGLKNFTYLATSGVLESDIRTFHRITGFKRLALLLDAPLWEKEDDLDRLAPLAESLEVHFIPPGPGRAGKPAPIPEEADAVLLGGLYRYPQAIREELIGEAIRKNLPLFSLKGESDVRIGALAGAAPEARIRRMARLLALRIETWAETGNLAAMPVSTDTDSRIFLNLETARRIGFSPPWDILVEADVLVDATQEGREGSLTDLLRDSLHHHNAVLQAEERLAQAESRLKGAAALRKPGLEAELRGSLRDKDQSVGGVAERSAEAGLSLSQALFSDSANTRVYTGEREMDQAAVQLEKARLDAVLDVGEACFSLLRSRTLMRIRKDTADHTRKNLEIARQRQEVGYTGRTEVLRWENALARARQELLAAAISVEQAKNTLKRRIRHPMDQTFGLADTATGEDFFAVSSIIPLLQEVRTPEALTRFSRFLEEEAARMRPEPKVLEAALSLAAREEAYQNRKPYTPELRLGASAAHVLDRSGEGSEISLPSDDRWEVGLRASWTLYNGGEIQAARATARSEIRRLDLERAETLRQIRETVRNRLADLTAASFDLTFSRQAAKASRENLALVQDAYAKGEIAIVELMDARNADISAREAEADARYALLLARLRLEHALGFYPALAAPENRDAFFLRYLDFKNGHAAS